MRHSVKKLHKLWAKSYMIQGQGQHVLNTLAHLKDQSRFMTVGEVDTPLTLQTPPLANVTRYDSLRANELEADHVQ